MKSSMNEFDDTDDDTSGRAVVLATHPRAPSQSRLSHPTPQAATSPILAATGSSDSEAMIAVARNLEEVRRALITIPGKFDAMNTVLERLCVATENLSAMPKSAGAMRVNGSSWVPRRGMGMCDCCFWTVLVLVVAFLFSGVLIVYAALTTSPDTRM